MPRGSESSWLQCSSPVWYRGKKIGEPCFPLLPIEGCEVEHLMRMPRDVARDIVPSPTISSIRRSELAVYLIPLAVTVWITDFHNPLLCHNLDSGGPNAGARCTGPSTTRPLTAFAYCSKRHASSAVSTARAVAPTCCLGSIGLVTWCGWGVLGCRHQRLEAARGTVLRDGRMELPG
jgi:hypothetical protein